ncbi:MAG: SPOR domain-containing protein [Candidatus Cyclonatronum sp.]|uniref:SPOR domain-containing protein n=1 Tax=Cyclonatronum sp. TaxID=3024185 RepID=UPI0025C41527|nr:SPOR domain-containing protein [Cyclonatronum sp.]MCC5934660.1 SPOR domain-containing protein [Balneolales bacterium]MCH8487184.1 SPOR domain-containing protein [Cyclonatronum sp.]
MLKERIYKAIGAEIRNKVLRDGSVAIEGLGLFVLDRMAARETVGDDGVVTIMPPVNSLGFEHRPEISEMVFFDSQADRIAAHAQASVPYTKEVIRELYAKIHEVASGEYLHAEGLGYFLNKTGTIGFLADDALAREVNFEFAGQLAVRLNAGKPTYFIPKALSLEDRLLGLENVSDRKHTAEKPQAPAGASAAQSSGIPEQMPADTAKAEKTEAAAQKAKTAEPAAAKKYQPKGESPLRIPEGIKSKPDKAVVIDDFPLNDETGKRKPRRQLTLFNKIAATIAVFILVVIGLYMLNILDVIQLGDSSRTVRTQPLTESISPVPRTSSDNALDIMMQRSRQALLRDMQQSDAGRETETQPAEDDEITGIDDESPGAAPQQIIAMPEHEIGQSPQPATTADSVQQPAAEVEAPQPEYGLRGEMEPFEQRPFGIVLHSLSTEALARQEMQVFETAGYRVTVYPATRPDGGTTWRVSVGQFETVDDAIAAALTLDEPWRSNNFISRLP